MTALALIVWHGPLNGYLSIDRQCLGVITMSELFATKAFVVSVVFVALGYLGHMSRIHLAVLMACLTCHGLCMWMPELIIKYCRRGTVSPYTFELHQMAYMLLLSLWPAAMGIIGQGVADFARKSIKGPCCSVCNYDLTGNVSGKCPECGVECMDKMVILRKHGA